MSMLEAAVAEIPTTEAICEVANQVWQCFVDPEGVLFISDTCPVGEGFVATVKVSGSWVGHVSLLLTREVASIAVQAMLERDADSDEEFFDGIGELGNMIGGNIKSLLPIECTMNTPHVRASDDLSTENQDAAMSMDLGWNGHNMRITITPDMSEA